MADVKPIRQHQLAATEEHMNREKHKNVRSNLQNNTTHACHM